MDSLFFNIINTLFIRVVNLSFSSIILIIALLTIRYLFKKIPHKIILFLWILVGARLIIPFSIENEIGIAPSINTFTYSSHTGATTSISSNINAIDEPVNNIIESTQSTSSTLSTLSIICTILTIIWLVGIITFISYGFIGYFRLRKITSNATRLQYSPV